MRVTGELFSVASLDTMESFDPALFRTSSKNDSSSLVIRTWPHRAHCQPKTELIDTMYESATAPHKGQCPWSTFMTRFYPEYRRVPQALVVLTLTKTDRVPHSLGLNLTPVLCENSGTDGTFTSTGCATSHAAELVNRRDLPESRPSSFSQKFRNRIS